MKTRLIATLSTLTLAAFAGPSAHADESGVALEWQKPGYVMEVVRVTAKRPPATDEVALATEAVTLAWQEPGYQPEVIVVTASRSQALSDFWAEARERAVRNPRRAAWNGLGAPAR